MNQQTETKKPLWKVLNEQRTKGDWGEDGCAIDSDQFEICIMSTGAKDQDGNTIKWTECEVNAQYTALAVNNLHHLAEALGSLIHSVEHEGEVHGRISEALETAKESLNRIS